MGMRGVHGAKAFLIPGSDGWLDMILGPLVETPANVERVKRNWRAGGREAVLARWRKRDELPWAYWRCDVPRKLFNQARKHYQTDAAAMAGLGIAPPDIPPVKSSSL